jgi:COP9 signalosome complex subunit 5
MMYIAGLVFLKYKGFRVYPPEYTPPMNETPDGTLIADDRSRVEKWGACWNRYYKLEVSYFMSSLAQSTLGILKNKFLWQNTFSSSPMLEPGNANDKWDLAPKISIYRYI